MDLTSQKEGRWKRLNTLAHYNVSGFAEDFSLVFVFSLNIFSAYCIVHVNIYQGWLALLTLNCSWAKDVRSSACQIFR
jgi:hypothetical protein